MNKHTLTFLRYMAPIPTFGFKLHPNIIKIIFLTNCGQEQNKLLVQYPTNRVIKVDGKMIRYIPCDALKNNDF